MDDATARALLARERARIERAIEDAERPADDREDAVFDTGDSASDLLESEIGEGVARRLRDELDAIERAERRLAEGTYGRSIESGEPIPDARLQGIPWAERTAEEQARFEASG